MTRRSGCHSGARAINEAGASQTKRRESLQLSNRPIRNQVAAVFSSGMLKVPHLNQLLGVGRIVARPDPDAAAGIDFVVGWGTKPTARRARAYARRTGLPYVAIEDGFLRSAGSASAKLPPISAVLDDVGVYYEAARPSRVEHLIRAAPDLDAVSIDEARDGLEAFLRHRLTKYNTVAPDRPARRHGRIRVLLVDQVFGDQSIAGGLASAASFRRMIDTALAAFPAGSIAVKVHPDVLAGRARGYIDRQAVAHGLTIIADMGNPHDLLDDVDTVWTVTSQLGLEAVFKGIPVRCFGVPFYAGWGVTEDTPDDVVARTALIRRGARRTALDIFAAAYLCYPNYADPVGGQPISLAAAIDRLVRWRDRAEANRKNVVCVGWPLEHRRTARAHFGDGGNKLSFKPAPAAVAEAARTNARLLVWDGAGGGRLAAAARKAGLECAEIGRAPVSVLDPVEAGGVLPALTADDRVLVCDRDPATAIEDLLSHHPFSGAERRRAAKLRQQLFAGSVARPEQDGDRKVVAVFGERFDRARHGETKAFRNNMDFLGAVRADRPDALISYVEHPDLALRDAPGWLSPQRASHRADRFDDFGTVLSGEVRVDEIHTIAADTALMALLAGHKVVCWGTPFYAGWGLTEDRAPMPRRKRRLTVDELAAAVLFLLPRHVDARTGVPCDIEDVVARLRAERDGRMTAAMRPRGPWYSPVVRSLRRTQTGLRHFAFFA